MQVTVKRAPISKPYAQAFSTIKSFYIFNKGIPRRGGIEAKRFELRREGAVEAERTAASWLVWQRLAAQAGISRIEPSPWTFAF